MKRYSILFAVSLLSLGVFQCAAQGTAFTYQGRLSANGSPANGNYDLLFTIYASATGTSDSFANQTNAASISNGLFTATLDFGPGIFTGPERWVEIAVRTNGGGAYTVLGSRQKLTATPYAMTAGSLSGVLGSAGIAGTYSNAVTFSNSANRFSGSFTGDGGSLTNLNVTGLGNGFWRTAGNTGTTPGANFLGTTDNQSLEIQVNGTRALRIEPHGSAAASLAGGYLQNSVSGYHGAAIAGGGTSGSPNYALGNYAFVGAGHGGQAADYSAVVAGAYNVSPGQFSFIGSGLSNTNLSDYALIGGGWTNRIQAASPASVIAGGRNNLIENDSLLSTLGGGQLNHVGNNAGASTIGGGDGNSIDAGAGSSVIAGGSRNLIRSGSVYSTVGGGIGNISDGTSSTVGGGYQNTASGPASIVGGGSGNVSAGSYATVSGGANNASSGQFATVAGGQQNSATVDHATIVGGLNNSVTAGSGFIGGGNANAVNDLNGTVSGGIGNVVNGNASTIAGGFRSIITTGADNSNIGGGYANTNSGFAASIGGGYLNINGGAYAVVAGGGQNQALGFSSTVGGGYNNVSDGQYTTISGGASNTNAADHATIGGGAINSNNGEFGTIAGGYRNQTFGGFAAYTTVGGGYANISSVYCSTVAGGFRNTSSNQMAVVSGGQQNTSGGLYGTIPGGVNNFAGHYCFAAGRNAKATHQGSFVWADSQSPDFPSTANNQFNIRANGGVWLNTDTSMFFGNQTRQMLNLFGTGYGIGVQGFTMYFRTDPSGGFSWFQGGDHNNGQNNPGGGTELMRLHSNGDLNISGAFGSLSDRNAKQNFEPVNADDVLEKVVALPLSKWSYKTDASNRHIGPMAQDFYAAFDVGGDDKHIATVDADGVALAAIQGLNQKLENELKRRDVENAELKRELASLKKLILQVARQPVEDSLNEADRKPLADVRTSKATTLTSAGGAGDCGAPLLNTR